MFNAKAFDYVMTFKYQIKLKFDYSKNEKNFRSEIKTFFLASKVLFFRQTKQTIKKVADTTFKISCYGSNKRRLKQHQNLQIN